jgi:hypothetical protein
MTHPFVLTCCRLREVVHSTLEPIAVACLPLCSQRLEPPHYTNPHIYLFHFQIPKFIIINFFLILNVKLTLVILGSVNTSFKMWMSERSASVSTMKSLSRVVSCIRHTKPWNEWFPWCWTKYTIISIQFNSIQFNSILQTKELIIRR